MKILIYIEPDTEKLIFEIKTTGLELSPCYTVNDIKKIQDEHARSNCSLPSELCEKLADDKLISREIIDQSYLNAIDKNVINDNVINFISVKNNKKLINDNVKSYCKSNDCEKIKSLFDMNYNIYIIIFIIIIVGLGLIKIKYNVDVNTKH